MDNVNLKIQRVSGNAKLPTYATEDSACFDLYSTSTEVISPGHSTTVGTGIAVEVPRGYQMCIFSRSGHGFKNDVRLGNCVGVIDSDYRGEVMVRIRNEGRRYFVVEEGHRIAQASLIPIPRVRFEEVSELSETDRGGGGFGSTGQ